MGVTDLGRAVDWANSVTSPSDHAAESTVDERSFVRDPAYVNAGGVERTDPGRFTAEAQQEHIAMPAEPSVTTSSRSTRNESVQCLDCGSINPGTNRFCRECGTPLSAG